MLWEGSLLEVASQGISVHRTKGRIVTQEGEEWVLQGVREVYEFRHLGKAHGHDSKIVLIGEGLKRQEIEYSLRVYLGV